MKKRLIMSAALIFILTPLFSGYTTAIPLDMAEWQLWLDKYIMPIGLSIVTCIGSILTVWSKIKSFRNTYKTDKDAFWASAQTEISGIKAATDLAIANIVDVKDKTIDAISKMPISTIQADLAQNTNDTTANAKALVTFKEMFKVFLIVMQKQTESQIIGKEEKENLYKIFDSAQQKLAEISQADEWKSVEHQVKEVNCDEQKI